MTNVRRVVITVVVVVVTVSSETSVSLSDQKIRYLQFVGPRTTNIPSIKSDKMVGESSGNDGVERRVSVSIVMIDGGRWK